MSVKLCSRAFLAPRNLLPSAPRVSLYVAGVQWVLALASVFRSLPSERAPITFSRYDLPRRLACVVVVFFNVLFNGCYHSWALAPPRLCRVSSNTPAARCSLSPSRAFYTRTRPYCQHFFAIFLIFFSKPCKPFYAALRGRLSYQSGDAPKRRTSPYNAPQGHIGLSHARAHAPARYLLFAHSRTHARTPSPSRKPRAPLPAPERAPHAAPERRPEHPARRAYRRRSIYCKGGAGIGTSRGGEGVKSSTNYIYIKE